MDRLIEFPDGYVSLSQKPCDEIGEIMNSLSVLTYELLYGKNHFRLLLIFWASTSVIKYDT